MNQLSGSPELEGEQPSRRCSRCGNEKPINEFVLNRSDRSGHGYHCKPCHNRVSRENRERVHGSVQNYMLKHRYGITADEFDEMLARQEGVCAICLSRKARHVDHDHSTGLVRGILCFACNGALGQFDENLAWLERAIQYLEGHRDLVSESLQPYGEPHESKTCPDCRESKALDEFPRNRNSKDGRHIYCKTCHNVRGRESKKRLHGGSRHYHLSRRYGIGARDVIELIKTQDGLCAVCRERPAEQVDHDHGTGRVRGILCGGCNAGLGQLKEDPEIIRRAIDYLRRHRPDSVQEPSVPYILSVA